MQRQKIPSLSCLVILALVVALAAGCGGSNKKSSSTTTTATTVTTITTAVASKVAAEVPAATKSKGTLIVAADAHYAPDEFIRSNGKTVEGMDPDLAKALAGVMGLKVKIVNVSLSSIIPGLSYLVVMSKGQFKLTGTPYNVAPYGIAVPKGNGMAKPVLDALKVLMANSSYKSILSRWYVLSGAIKNPWINGAIS